MAQIIIRQPMTAKARVSGPGQNSGVCGRQSGSETRFTPNFSIVCCLYHSKNAPKAFMCHQRHVLLTAHNAIKWPREWSQCTRHLQLRTRITQFLPVDSSSCCIFSTIHFILRVSVSAKTTKYFALSSNASDFIPRVLGSIIRWDIVFDASTGPETIYWTAV
jgi:hypothetical protein